MSGTEINNSDKSVVLVGAEGPDKGGAGTGFVVAEGGIVATNHHVIAGATKIFLIVWPDSGANKPELMPATIVWDSPGLDLTILKVPNLNRRPLVLYEKIPEKGSKVISIGFPEVADDGLVSPVLESTLTEGVVGRIFEQPWRSKRNGPPLVIIQHSATINHGNSGGPLLDGCGRVVGVNTRIALDADARNQTLVPSAGINFASSITYINEALKSKNINHPSTEDDCISGGTIVPPSSNQALIFSILFIALALAAGALTFSLRKTKIVTETFTQFKRRSSSIKTVESIRAPAEEGALYLNGKDSTGKEVSFRLGKQLLSEGEVLVGRDSSQCQLAVDDPTISRTHAAIKIVDGILMIRDVGSTNGSSINGVALSNRFVPVKLGQLICFGKVRLKIVKGNS